MGAEGLGLKVWALGPVSALGWDLDAASHPADPGRRMLIQLLGGGSV